MATNGTNNGTTAITDDLVNKMIAYDNGLTEGLFFSAVISVFGISTVLSLFFLAIRVSPLLRSFLRGAAATAKDSFKQLQRQVSFTADDHSASLALAHAREEEEEEDEPATAILHSPRSRYAERGLEVEVEVEGGRSTC